MILTVTGVLSCPHVRQTGILLKQPKKRLIPGCFSGFSLSRLSNLCDRSPFSRLLRDASSAIFQKKPQFPADGVFSRPNRLHFVAPRAASITQIIPRQQPIPGLEVVALLGRCCKTVDPRPDLRRCPSVQMLMGPHVIVPNPKKPQGRLELFS